MALSATMQRRVFLLTGGAGMVGSHIARRLCSLGYVVRIYDDLSAYSFDPIKRFGLINLPVELIEGSICDTDKLSKAMSGVDFVVHLAALADVAHCTEDCAQSFRINVQGTHFILHLAKELKVEKVTFISSASVYGSPNVSRLNEKMTPAPESIYANYKLWGEHEARLFYRLYGLRTTSLRYFSVYGPGQVPKEGSHSWCVAIFAMRSLLKRPIVVYGNGKQVRDFIFVEDVAEATVKATLRKSTDGRVLNIGTGVATCILDAAQIIMERISTVPIEFVARRMDDPKGGAADTRLSAKLLQWQPRTSFADGVERYVDWLRQNADLIPDWIG